MRLLVLSAPLLLTLTTFARSPLRRGQATDTCANLNADLVFSDVLVDDKPYDAGRIHVGLCISQVEKFVGHYNVTEAAAKVVGVDKVESTVTTMIKKAGVQCSYPPHAKPSVTDSNECDFICTDGFLATPTNHPSSCTCPPYLTECDGQCGHFHSDCSTTPPPSRRQNEPKCGKDLTMCGVPDATWGQAYKCTDITSDSYTCGGCVKASPFGSPSTNGVNCHEIPNVDDVCCEDNQCFVHSCKNGFTVSTSNDGCIAEKVTRGLPLGDGNHVGDTAGVAREELPDRIVPGPVIDEKVPRTDPTSNVTREMLSAGKASLSGARSNVVNDISGDVKISRGFPPFTTHGTNTVAEVADKAGTHLARENRHR